MRQSILKMDPKKLEIEVGDGDLGTKLFSLYLAAKEIIEYRQYLPLRYMERFCLKLDQTNQIDVLEYLGAY